MASDAIHIETGLVAGPVAVTSMSWPGDCGAESIFVGRTRAETHGELGALLRLEYEVYAPMAEKLMDAMARETAEKYDGRAVRMMHANGPVGLGEASVVIQVATPHRGEAFSACRYLIDRLKHELPIWKHEIWEHGRTFVEGCCAHRDTNSQANNSPCVSDDHARRTVSKTSNTEGITT